MVFVASARVMSYETHARNNAAYFFFCSFSLFAYTCIIPPGLTLHRRVYSDYRIQTRFLNCMCLGCRPTFLFLFLLLTGIFFFFFEIALWPQRDDRCAHFFPSRSFLLRFTVKRFYSYEDCELLSRKPTRRRTKSKGEERHSLEKEILCATLLEQRTCYFHCKCFVSVLPFLWPATHLLPMQLCSIFAFALVSSSVCRKRNCFRFVSSLLLYFLLSVFSRART